MIAGSANRNRNGTSSKQPSPLSNESAVNMSSSDSDNDYSEDFEYQGDDPGFLPQPGNFPAQNLGDGQGLKSCGEIPKFRNSDVEDIGSKDFKSRDEILGDSDNEDWGFGSMPEYNNSASACTGSNGQAKQTPLCTGQPTPKIPRSYSKNAQQQSFNKEQCSDRDVESSDTVVESSDQDVESSDADLESSDQDIDFCSVYPDNPLEQLAIYNALHHTRQDCRSRLHLKDLDIRSSPWKPYLGQWLEMQEYFELLWSQADARKAPKLKCLKAWDGGFARWLPNMDYIEHVWTG